MYEISSYNPKTCQASDLSSSLTAAIVFLGMIDCKLIWTGDDMIAFMYPEIHYEM